MNHQELVLRRLDRGWSQSQLAKAAGLTQSRLKAYELGLFQMGLEVHTRLVLALDKPGPGKRWQVPFQESPGTYYRPNQLADREGLLCRELQLAGAQFGMASPLQRGFDSHHLLDDRGRRVGTQSLPCLALPGWKMWPCIELVRGSARASLPALICSLGRWYGLRLQKACPLQADVLGLPLIQLDPEQIHSQQLLRHLLVPREEP